jgi:hypothetical protein
MRFWISFYVPDPGGDTWPEWPGKWWISGETGGIGGHAPLLTVCGVVDADNECAAITTARSALGVSDGLRFCDPKAADWLPNSDRFKP